MYKNRNCKSHIEEDKNEVKTNHQIKHRNEAEKNNQTKSRLIPKYIRHNLIYATTATIQSNLIPEAKSKKLQTREWDPLSKRRIVRRIAMGKHLQFLKWSRNPNLRKKMEENKEELKQQISAKAHSIK